MKSYMYAYYGGKKPASKEEGMAHRQKWQSWIESLGDSVINPGTPLMNSQWVSKSEVNSKNGINGMNGFAIIKAESIHEAIEIAKSDPFLEMEGEIRVSEMMEMN